MHTWQVFAVVLFKSLVVGLHVVKQRLFIGQVPVVFEMVVHFLISIHLLDLLQLFETLAIVLDELLHRFNAL